MRVGSFAVARPSWYDRNSTEGSNSFSGNNGGFTNGYQFTYTVPTGKLFNMDSGLVGVWTSVVATVNGLAQAGLIFTPSGGNATSLLDGRVYIETAGVIVTQVLAGTVLIFPGGTIQAYAYAGQTGGTTAFAINYHGVIFDR
jgi:hypothetical protein